MTCKRCQTAMREGRTENVCHITKEVVAITHDSCPICTASKSDGIVETKIWNRRHGGWLTSQTAKENLARRFGGERSKRKQISASSDVCDKFYAAVPERDRRKRIDHALLVEIGEIVK